MSIQFGVDYYPEHWPQERWKTDARLMQEMGVQVVRMAEFSWSHLEPEEGRFTFEWLDQAIELLSRHGIRSVLGNREKSGDTAGGFGRTAKTFWWAAS